MKLLHFLALIALPALVVPARADHDAHYLTNGYSILYKLCEQERPLDLILFVKTSPKEIADFLHQVSKTAKDDVNLLDDLHEHDQSLKFDDPGLPPVEEDARGSIRDDKQHMLLFGTKGSAFVRTILVTQIEAGTYGTNVAKVLADSEPDARRAAIVRKIGIRWKKIRDRAYALLNAT